MDASLRLPSFSLAIPNRWTLTGSRLGVAKHPELLEFRQELGSLVHKSNADPSLFSFASILQHQRDADRKSISAYKRYIHHRSLLQPWHPRTASADIASRVSKLSLETSLTSAGGGSSKAQKTKKAPAVADSWEDEDVSSASEAENDKEDGDSASDDERDQDPEILKERRPSRRSRAPAHTHVADIRLQASFRTPVPVETHTICRTVLTRGQGWRA